MKFKDRLLNRSAAKRTRLILALDVIGPERSRISRAETILKDVKESVAGVKLNFHLLLPFGLNGVKRLITFCSREDIPLIADLKLNDISSTNKEVARQLIKHRIDAVIANPVTGLNDGLDELVQLSHAGELGLILLVYMSHKGAEEIYGTGQKGLYLFFAERAKEWNADGVIASAKSDSIIRKVRATIGKEIMIFSPGVGVQGGEARKPIEAGADFIIVGRSIINSSEPGVMAERYKAESYAK
ncbi:MAG: orotidine-5'-phosphate decarboxylase [Conexivisphaerales archaeon]